MDEKNPPDNNITPTEPLPSSISQLSATWPNTLSVSQIAPNISLIIFCSRFGVLRDLIDGLKEIDIIKSKQKEYHEAAMEEICLFEIQIYAKVGKKTAWRRKRVRSLEISI